MPETTLNFGPYSIDCQNEVLAEGDREISLTPKAYSVLLYFVEHPRSLVTKRDLLDNVWHDSIVGDAVIKVCVRELRMALKDDSKAPTYVETVHRKGYRFICDVEQVIAPGAETAQGSPVGVLGPGKSAPLLSPPLPPCSSPVGREEALSTLSSLAAEAKGGQRRTVFVVGEAGLGKTALLRSFAASLDDSWCVLFGHCIENVGRGEAFLPVLEAMGSLARSECAQALKLTLQSAAPAVLHQLSYLLSTAEREELRIETQGTSSARLLREMADALEALAGHGPLMLILEDLHWCDPETIDLIALLGQRMHSLPLMIVGSHRSETAPQRLVELAARDAAGSLDLSPLSESEVLAYLQQEMGGDAVGQDIAQFLFSKTQGQPLLMVALLRELRDNAVLGQDSRGTWTLTKSPSELQDLVPANIRQIVERRLGNLTSEQVSMLEAGSAAAIVGTTFSAESVGAALRLPPEEVEIALESLDPEARLIVPSGTLRWGQSAFGPRYTFLHDLYLRALYQRIPEARRFRFHRAIPKRGLELFGDAPEAIADEIAGHFELAEDRTAAIPFRILAARQALRDYRINDAQGQLDRASRPLPSEIRVRLDLLRERGRLLRFQGRHEEAEQELLQAEEFAKELGDISRGTESLIALSMVQFWTDRQAALASAARAVELSATGGDEELMQHASGYDAHLRLTLGSWDDKSAAACLAAEDAARGAGRKDHLCLHVARNVYLRCLKGDYAEAVTSAEEGIIIARDEVFELFDQILCLFWGSWALLHLGSLSKAESWIETGHRIADRSDHALWSHLFALMSAHLMIFRGEPQAALAPIQATQEFATATSGESGQVVFHARMLEALAQSSLKQPKDALAAADLVLAEASADGALMDRILAFPLHLARARAYLQLNELSKASSAAQELCDATTCTGEKTYLAISHLLEAQVATQQKKSARATKHRKEASQLAGSESALEDLCFWVED